MRIGRHGQAGMALIGLLVVVAILGLGLAATGTTWSAVQKRSREQEFRRVGEMYAQALDSYYLRSPGSLKEFPTKVDDLLLDARFVGVVRHLRRAYPDPLTNGPWRAVRNAQGRIIGVQSESLEVALTGRYTVEGEQQIQPYRSIQFLASSAR
jgi:type II secretory pathway pseudopilin PulG